MEGVKRAQPEPVPMDVDLQATSDPQVADGHGRSQPAATATDGQSSIILDVDSHMSGAPIVLHNPLHSSTNIATSSTQPSRKSPQGEASKGSAPGHATPLALSDRGKESVFRVDQSNSAWQTAQEALSAGLNAGVSTMPTSQRTGGRRGRGPRRNPSPVPYDSITVQPRGGLAGPSTPNRGAQRTRAGNARGGRSRKSFSSSKRKRGSGSEGEKKDDSSSEEVTTLPSISRSGRKITQAAHHPANIKLEDEEMEGGEQPSPAPAPAPAPSPAPGPKQQFNANALSTLSPRPGKQVSKPGAKKVKRTPGQSAVCKNCSRGHSPSSNAIVFCDGCNTPWHQYCHDPPIKQEYLLQVDKDWFCGDCVMLRENSTILEGKVAGHGMSMLEKRKYLKSLPPSTLLVLLLHASSLYPNLPIFPPKPAVVSIDMATLDAQDVALYEEVVDELPYPKAGNGIQLRPEHEDLGILVDDNASIYSHRWTGIGEMMMEAGWAGRHAGVRTANSGMGIKSA